MILPLQKDIPATMIRCYPIHLIYALSLEEFLKNIENNLR